LSAEDNDWYDFSKILEKSIFDRVLLESTSPEYIYHYTDLNALLGMVSGKIWLSNIRYLNDRTEFVHGRDLLVGALESYRSDERYSWFVDEIVKKITSEVSTTQIFSCSFSANGDLLSQWRGYCPSSGGVSIGFNSSFVNGNISDCRLLPVVYSGDRQVGLIDDILSSIIPKINKAVDEMDGESIDMLILCISEYLSIICSLMKDSSFVEEMEYRLIIIGPLMRAQHRVSKGIIIPYIEKNFEFHDCVDRIIIGPSEKKDLIKAGLMSILKSDDPWASEVEIVDSIVPLRL